MQLKGGWLLSLRERTVIRLRKASQLMLISPPFTQRNHAAMPSGEASSPLDKALLKHFQKKTDAWKSIHDWR